MCTRARAWMVCVFGDRVLADMDPNATPDKERPWLLPQFHLLNGLILPIETTANLLETLKKFPLQNSDIWIASYPKTGTTWTLKIVSLLLNGGIDTGKRITEVVPWLEKGVQYETAHNVLSKRCFKSHSEYKNMPCGLPHQTRCKYIYVARNPKDSLVSYYFHYRAFVCNDLHFETFYGWFVSGFVGFGDYFKHVLGWWAHRDDPNVLFLKYEDMKKDLVGAVTRISTFIGSDSSEDVIREVTRKSLFESMKVDPSVSYEWVPTRNKEAEPFIRKGEVGDWKNYLSKEQSDTLDAICQGQLSPVGLTFEFS